MDSENQDMFIRAKDGVTLVRERGRLMQIACDAEPGTMAAVLGLEPAQLREICRCAYCAGEPEKPITGG